MKNHNNKYQIIMDQLNISLFIFYTLIKLKQYNCMSNNKYLIYGGLALASISVLLGVVYIKNKALYKPLSKEKVVQITIDFRKALQQTLQNVVTISEKAKVQKLPPETMKHLLEGENSLDIKVQIREQTENVCKAHQTNAVDYEKAISHFAKDDDIKKYTSILQKDYEFALKGQTNPQLFGALPEITLQKFFDIVKKKIQQDYLNKLEIIRMTKDKTDAETNDPYFVAEVNTTFTAGVEDILKKNGLRSDTDASIHIFNILLSNFEKKDATLRVKIKNVETTYNQIFEKYLRVFRETRSEQSLNNIEDQILYREI